MKYIFVILAILSNVILLQAGVEDGLSNLKSPETSNKTYVVLSDIAFEDKAIFVNCEGEWIQVNSIQHDGNGLCNRRRYYSFWQH